MKNYINDKIYFDEVNEKITSQFIDKYQNEVKKYSDELLLLRSKKQTIIEYINEIQNIHNEKIKNNNGLSDDLKMMPDYNYFPAYRKFVKWLENRENELMNFKGSKNSNQTGFEIKLTNKQIESLFKQMQSYIDTTLENFKAIFKNEPFPADFKPIKRKKEFTVVLCAYFVSELFQKENPNDYWDIAENCFNAKNLRQSQNNAFKYNPTHKPKGFEKIDAILKNIYNPLQ